MKPFCLSFFLLLSIFLLNSPAYSHATIVLGKLSSDPETPKAGESFRLHLEMVDPSQLAIEDAVVFADFQKQGQTEIIRADFSETSPGIYSSSASLPQAGMYSLIMRDQTFRQEEARATLTFFVGEGANDIPIAFVFPPTATGNSNLLTWLIWLIAVPVIAGIAVTVMVFMNANSKEAEND